MARRPNPDIRKEDLYGVKPLKLLLPIFEKLHPEAWARDRARNRRLHFDQYCPLILLYFFNPIVTSLRGIGQAGQLRKVQRILKCQRAALGSLSEAGRVFDADLLRGVLGELVDRLPAIQGNTRLDEVRGVLTLVDGALLPTNGGAIAGPCPSGQPAAAITKNARVFFPEKLRISWRKASG